MKNLNVASADFQTGSIHDEIYSGCNNDFIYRKAYKGDWGHWDDLPSLPDSTENYCNSTENQSPTASESLDIYENSFL